LRDVATVVSRLTNERLGDLEHVRGVSERASLGGGQGIDGRLGRSADEALSVQRIEDGHPISISEVGQGVH
jgi:hypothetical protein